MTPIQGRARERQLEALKHEYTKGLEHGVIDALRHLEHVLDGGADVEGVRKWIGEIRWNLREEEGP